jgi:hypothetical protein
VKHGYVEYAALASLPSTQEQQDAWADCIDTYEMCMLTASGAEPQTRRMAEKSPDWLGPNGWQVAENDEIQSLFDMKVVQWIADDQVPIGAKVLDSKIVYKDKVATPGVPGRKKCRCVGRGFQESMADYGDSFAPVCRQNPLEHFLPLLQGLMRTCGHVMLGQHFLLPLSTDLCT